SVAAGDVDATDDRSRPHFEFLPLRPTRLALLGLAAALTEGTCGSTAGATTTTATTTGAACEATTGTCTGATTGSTGTAGTTGATGTLLERSAARTTTLAT